MLWRALCHRSGTLDGLMRHCDKLAGAAHAHLGIVHSREAPTPIPSKAVCHAYAPRRRRSKEDGADANKG